MTAVKDQRLMLKKLKAQVVLLQRKEHASHHKLRAALRKMHKLGKVYKSKLARKLKNMKGKIAEAEAKVYVRVADDVERQMHKKVEAKERALGSVVAKFDKKFAAKLAKSIKKRASQMKKRKVAKAKPAKAKSAKKKVVKKTAKKVAKKPAAKRAKKSAKKTSRK